MARRSRFPGRTLSKNLRQPAKRTRLSARNALRAIGRGLTPAGTAAVTGGHGYKSEFRRTPTTRASGDVKTAPADVPPAVEVEHLSFHTRQPARRGRGGCV